MYEDKKGAHTFPHAPSPTITSFLRISDMVGDFDGRELEGMRKGLSACCCAVEFELREVAEGKAAPSNLY